MKWDKVENEKITGRRRLTKGKKVVPPSPVITTRISERSAQTVPGCQDIITGTVPCLPACISTEILDLRPVPVSRVRLATRYTITPADTGLVQLWALSAVTLEIRRHPTRRGMYTTRSTPTSCNLTARTRFLQRRLFPAGHMWKKILSKSTCASRKCFRHRRQRSHDSR